MYIRARPQPLGAAIALQLTKAFARQAAVGAAEGAQAALRTRSHSTLPTS